MVSQDFSQFYEDSISNSTQESMNKLENEIGGGEGGGSHVKIKCQGCLAENSNERSIWA